MRRTVTWPPRLESGGWAMTAAPDDPLAEDPGESLRQIIRLRVLPGTNSNAFNGPIGLTDPTWQPLTTRSAARTRAGIITQFDGLEQGNRARLLGVELRADPADGVMRIEVDYEDLETGRREGLEVPLNA